MARTLAVEDLPNYTYDDYVNWEGRWEVIHGIPYAMAPSPTYKHQSLSHRIAGQLYRLLEHSKFCHAVLPVDWEIRKDTVVQPDNMVVCGENADDKKLTIAPVLVFEILSPSTAAKDKMLKYKLYQEAGVKYYCIVDPNQLSADVFVLKQDKYMDKLSFIQEGKMVFDLGPCEIAFDFNEVFRKFSK